jgi:hypothetical protein
MTTSSPAAPHVLDHLPPKPGARIRVIGAGLPRTATNSFCEAISFLLDGPTYHAGRQWCGAGAPESQVLRLSEICEAVVGPKGTPTQWPAATVARPDEVRSKLSSLLEGYVATADPPLSQLTPQLLQLYPDAIVICTIRDRKPWLASISAMMATVISPWILGGLFFWVKGARHMPRIYNGMERVWAWRYGPGADLKISEEAGVAWDRHVQHLKEIVPKDQLVFYDVREGWGPLCEALGVPESKVKGVPFPRVNDKESLEKHFEGLAKQGIQRWLMFVAVVVGVGALLWRWLV